MCIVIVCFQGCDVIDLKINLSFHIKPFSHMTKISGQTFKCLKNKKSFQDEIKSIFHLLEGKNPTLNMIFSFF